MRIPEIFPLQEKLRPVFYKSPCNASDTAQKLKKYFMENFIFCEMGKCYEEPSWDNQNVF